MKSVRSLIGIPSRWHGPAGIAVLACLLPASASAATTWTGGFGENWSTGSNWDNGVTDPFGDVFIDSDVQATCLRF